MAQGKGTAVNLQERLERILDERRSYVVGHEPGPDDALAGLLMTCTEGALGAENQHERDGWLVRMCGLALFALHPEDEASVEGTWLTAEELERRVNAMVPDGAFHVVRGLDHNGQPAGLPRPLPAGAHVHIVDENQIWIADGQGEWDKRGPVVIGREPQMFTMVRKGDGTYKRKPRPDRA